MTKPDHCPKHGTRYVLRRNVKTGQIANACLLCDVEARGGSEGDRKLVADKLNSGHDLEVRYPWTSVKLPQTSSAQKSVLMLIVGMMFIITLASVIQGRHEQSVFNSMSPAEHLRQAKANSDVPTTELRHLAAIPPGSPEYEEVPALRQAAEEVEREDRLRRERNEAGRAKEQRDSDASLSSYWPTTVRVETDMDSFWLNGEERTCLTTPGANGRVAIVTCNDSDSHRTHNIPVKFWGGVERNRVSSWRCRREGDYFVRRALD
jgi:hypothetical protein